MSYVNPIWLEAQRQRWQRHDWQRFVKPEPVQRKTYAERLVEQRRVREQESLAVAEQEALRESLLSIRRELAELKFELACRRIFRKYNPNQPRVPKGDPKGGQWEKGGGSEAGKEGGLVTKPAAMLWKDKVDAVFGQKDLFTEVGGGSGGGGGRPGLPALRKDGPTAGVLRSPGKEDVRLVSGEGGPASQMPARGSGYDIINRTHVEGQAAATMRLKGMSEGTLYINNPTICSRCIIGLPRMLPAGAKLDVVLPSGATRTFFGVP